MKLPVPKCKMRTIYTYDFLGMTLDIEFIKAEKTPGFTHMVIINGIKRDWLGDNCKPSKQSALYFYTKHAPTMQNRSTN